MSDKTTTNFIKINFLKPILTFLLKLSLFLGKEVIVKTESLCHQGANRFFDGCL